MSASPSGFSNGRTPNSSNGQPQFVRKAKAADPLVPRKKPVRRLNNSSAPNAPRPNGLVAASAGRSQQPQSFNSKAQVPQRPAPNQRVQGFQSNARPKVAGGWTTEHAEGTYQDFPLFTTKRALREGFRYHIARFAGKRTVDPTDQDEFTRPVSLHRRDPKLPPPGKDVKDEAAAGEPVDDKERERQELLKIEREAQRAADLAQIAPTGNNAASAAKKNRSFKNEKTSQVYRIDETKEQKRESDLRYEESLPWHLEDADNKNTWVGNYEAALSDTNVMLVIDEKQNCFRMVPLEKWYKFTSKNQFKTFTIEEAEAAMSKKTKESRWVMRGEEKLKAEQEARDSRKALQGLYTVKGESATFKQSAKGETQDMDDLDYEDDLFADDEEHMTVEKQEDEETKEATDRIKREQLGANLFGAADEAQIEKELQEIEQEAEDRKKLGKGVKKALKKREKNYIYDSDSEHPYSSDDSEDDTSDEEKQKDADRKKDEEAKRIEKLKNESKLPSGASSKGTNTPSGRPKFSDPTKKANHLKRPGSPNLSASEASGNESSRKKHKKKHGASSQPAGSSTPIPGSRPISPEPSSQSITGQATKAGVKANMGGRINATSPGAGSGSDGEATGGEMSDGAGGKKKSLKLRLGGPRNGINSPSGSRAGSPAVGSRSGTPAVQSANKSSGSIITTEELKAALPKDGRGLTLKELLGLFPAYRSELSNPEQKKNFIALVKQNLAYGTDKLLRAK